MKFHVLTDGLLRWRVGTQASHGTEAEKAKVDIVGVKSKINSKKISLNTLQQEYSAENIVYLEAIVTDVDVQKRDLETKKQELLTNQLQYENLEGKISLFEHRIPKHLDDINYYNI